ncbi:MAG: type II toxin-antitoxin system HicA family toxin [Parachlamydiaceae bacterium]|nr:type II toxin-antitoxin system HicA family toxin [Parachlamydiaceae bacterium]
MENLNGASSNPMLWNAIYPLSEGITNYDADIENFNQYCNMIMFNNGPKISPQLGRTAMQMQSFMDAMKQHGASKKELYNFAQASLPMLQRENEKISLCSVKIEEIRGDRLQRRGAMLNKISGAQLNLTNYSTQSSIFASKTNPITSHNHGSNTMPDEKQANLLEKMGLANIGTTVINKLGEGIGGWFEEVANNFERQGKAICNKNSQIKGKCEAILDLGPQIKGAVAEQFQKLEPLIDGFDLYPTKAVMNAAAGLNDPMAFSSGAITHEDAFIGALGELHAAATVVKIVGHGVAEVTKVIFCGTSAEGKQACKSTLDLAGKAIKATAEFIGVKEPIKKAISYVNSFDGSSIAEILIDHGTPQEQAIALSKQASSDLKLIALSIVPIGTVGTLAKKGFKSIVKNGSNNNIGFVNANEILMKGRFTRLLSYANSNLMPKPPFVPAMVVNGSKFQENFLVSQINESSLYKNFQNATALSFHNHLPSYTVIPKKSSSVYCTIVKEPSLSITAKVKNFIKDEFGGGKLPIERDFIIDLFEKIGYAKVKGGKGSHEKWRKANSKMIIIPQGQNGELARGTVNSLMKTYDDAINVGFSSPTLPSTKQTSKLLDNYVGSQPLPHRIDYSHNYLQAKMDFIGPKEFKGALSKDLYVVQFHGSGPLGQGRSHKWFIPVSQSNKMFTIEEVKDAVAKLSSYGDVTQVTLAKIPAGEPIRFLHGKAKQKVDSVTNETKAGGGVQYRFFDFDPNWVVQTRKLL